MSADTERCPPPVTELTLAVMEFHEAMGAPVLSTPCVPSRERIQLRLRLIGEEFLELLEACDAPGFAFEEAKHWIGQVISGCGHPSDVDIVEAADALADLDYVVEGTRLEFGINGAPIAREVHRSNMAKRGGSVREDGKFQKPPGWTPPDIAGELRRQGWEDNFPTERSK